MAKTYKHLLKERLIKLSRLGQSRHRAKDDLRKEYKEKGLNKPFEKAVDGIYSIKTFQNYLEHGNHFIEWCIDNHYIKSYGKKLEDLEIYATDYLQTREYAGYSLYTLKAEKAALGKIFGHEIDYKFKKTRSVKNITRSRERAVRDSHFSEKRNRDLVIIAKATGGRREDLSKLQPQDFILDRFGNLWVHFQQSKGGRDRFSPVLREYKNEVLEIIKDKIQNKPIFPSINGNADIHSYRREYAQGLYNDIENAPIYRAEIALKYPVRHEKATGKYYYSHTKEMPFKGSRENIYIVSQALGHNRLDVTVNHYLKA